MTKPRDEYAVAVGKKIAESRKAIGWSQSMLAAAAGFNTVNQIGQYEIGTRSPKLSTAQKIARALGVSVDSLLPTKP